MIVPPAAGCAGYPSSSSCIAAADELQRVSGRTAMQEEVLRDLVGTLRGGERDESEGWTDEAPQADEGATVTGRAADPHDLQRILDELQDFADHPEKAQELMASNPLAKQLAE